MKMKKLRILFIAVVFLSAVSICQAEGSLEAKLAKLEAALKARQSTKKKGVGKTSSTAATTADKLHVKVKTFAERLDELMSRQKDMQEVDKGLDARLAELDRKFETSKTQSQSRAQKAHDALYAKLAELERKLQGLKARSNASAAKQTSISGAAEAQGNAPVLQTSSGESSGQEVRVAQVAELSSEAKTVRAKPKESATEPVMPKILNVSAMTSSAQAQGPATKAAEPNPKAGPKYLNLRYNENFSYLADPDTPYRKDVWDPIKWIELNAGWHLTLGGQARLRFESETDKGFGGAAPTQDAFLLQRYFLHTDLRHADGLRFFLQGKFAHANFRDKGGWAGLEDHADFQQAFVDLPTPFAGRPVTFRLGRQELQYGAQRLISPLDWGNLRRTFDGIKVFADLPDWRVDVFAVRPVINDRRNLDDEDENKDFYGLYTTWKGSKALAADFYALLLKDNNLTTNSNSRTGTRTVYTIGNRLYGKRGSWDYETEAATQFGTYAGDRVRAWMATVGGGYTFADVMWKPRLGLLYDYASGDRNPSDGTHSTFNQYFPLGHAWFGYLDRVGRSNIHAIKAQLKVKPSNKLTAWADFHTFFADQDRDSLYGANGKPIRSGGAGGSHKIGHELDLTMKYAIDKHTTVLAGWAHMFPGGFIKRTGTSEDADFLYAQIEYKF